MEMMKEPSALTQLARIVLASSMFVGCSAEKPIPVTPEALSGPNANLLLDRRVLMDGELSFVKAYDASYSYSNGFISTPSGGILPLGDTYVQDTDYTYKFTPKMAIKGSPYGFVSMEERVPGRSSEPVPAKVSAVFRGIDPSGAIKLEDFRVEVVGP